MNDGVPINVGKITFGELINSIKRMYLTSIFTLLSLMSFVIGTTFSFGLNYENLRDCLIPPKWTSEEYDWSEMNASEIEGDLNKLGLHPNYVLGDFSYIDKGGISRITIWNRTDKPNEGWKWQLKKKPNVLVFRDFIDKELGNGNVIPLGITNKNIAGFYLLATDSGNSDD